MASSNLKRNYVKKLIKWLVEQPLTSTDKTNRYIEREEGYIDLAILAAEQVDKEWTNSDRDTLMKQQYLQKKSIDIHNIVQDEDEMVMVRGVAGIGKSTLMEMYTLKWAKGEILKGQETNPTVDFLFVFTCREINTLEKNISLEQLIHLSYPEVFQYVTLKDLKHMSDRVMIIVDGLDELEKIYSVEHLSQESDFEDFQHLQIVNDLIDTKGSFLPGHKSIGCGRPKACAFLKSHLLESNIIKTVEVCGFNSDNIQRYIRVFFNYDTKKIKKVQDIIEKSNNLKVMASVPVFLWIICNVYGENLIAKAIHTNTELYFYGCLVFIRNHLQGVKKCQYKCLIDLINDSTVCAIINSLAKLSATTYMNHQVVFTEKDIKNLKCPIHLEQTGFIVKYAQNNLNKSCYQFKHLVFQEFLCSLYLCISKNVGSFKTNRELSSCTPTILGIHRILENKENKLFTELFENLLTIKHSSPGNYLKRYVRTRSYKLYIKELTKLGNDVKELIRNGVLLINENYFRATYMETVFEGRYRFPAFVLHEVEDILAKVELRSQIHIRNAVYLLNGLQVKVISEISIIFDEVTSDILELLRLVGNGGIVHAKVFFLVSAESNVSVLAVSKQIVIECKSSIATDVNGLLKLMSIIEALQLKHINSIQGMAFDETTTDILELLKLVDNNKMCNPQIVFSRSAESNFLIDHLSNKDPIKITCKRSISNDVNELSKLMSITDALQMKDIYCIHPVVFDEVTPDILKLLQLLGTHEILYSTIDFLFFAESNFSVELFANFIVIECKSSIATDVNGLSKLMSIIGALQLKRITSIQGMAFDETTTDTLELLQLLGTNEILYSRISFLLSAQSNFYVELLADCKQIVIECKSSIATDVNELSKLMSIIEALQLKHITSIQGMAFDLTFDETTAHTLKLLQLLGTHEILYTRIYFLVSAESNFSVELFAGSKQIAIECKSSIAKDVNGLSKLMSIIEALQLKYITSIQGMAFDETTTDTLELLKLVGKNIIFNPQIVFLASAESNFFIELGSEQVNCKTSIAKEVNGFPKLLSIIEALQLKNISSIQHMKFDEETPDIWELLPLVANNPLLNQQFVFLNSKSILNRYLPTTEQPTMTCSSSIVVNVDELSNLLSIVEALLQLKGFHSIHQIAFDEVTSAIVDLLKLVGNERQLRLEIVFSDFMTCNFSIDLDNNNRLLLKFRAFALKDLAHVEHNLQLIVKALGMTQMPNLLELHKQKSIVLIKESKY